MPPTDRPTLAYLAGAFPAASETFVYREVRGLRRRGWTVHPVGLHAAAPAIDGDGLDEFRRDPMAVYGGGPGEIFAELLAHPLRAAGTVGAAVADAVWPGEPARLVDRLKGVGQALAALGLAGRLRERGVGHVHCHFAHAPATVGMYAARHLGVPFSFTGHANDLFERRALLKRKLRRAAFVACISRWHRDFYRDAGGPGLVDCRLPVIRCGVEVAPDSVEIDAGPEIPAAGRPFRVVTVCRLVEKKGVDVLLQGLSLLPADLPWRLTVAGDGPLRGELEELAVNLGVNGRVRWLGSVANGRVAELLADADVFALICRTDARGDRDGIPVALMEAMAAGVAVLAGELPAVRELVADGETGRLVDGTDPAAVAGALEGLARDVPQRRALAEAGRRRVGREFSLPVTLDGLERAVMSSVRPAAPSAIVAAADPTAVSAHRSASVEVE